MGYIGNEPTTGHFPVQTNLVGPGPTYTLDRAPATAGAIEVSVQGVLQPTTAYSVSGTTLTMAGVASGIPLFIRYFGETITVPTIADGVVTTAKLSNDAVTGAKIAMGSDAAGDVLTYTGTDYVRLAKGTASQVLSMNAGATAVEWASAAGGITSKVITGTYDVSTTGDLVVTGAGFRPSTVIALCNYRSHNAASSVGFTSNIVTDDGALINRHNQTAESWTIQAILWQLHTVSGSTATAIVKTYDSDGATFTKAISAGTPTGTGEYFLLFIK